VLVIWHLFHTHRRSGVYGALLFRDPNRAVGVVWCEDGGALAYVNSDTRVEGGSIPSAGSMVRVQTVEYYGIRICVSLEAAEGRRDDLIAALQPTGAADREAGERASNDDREPGSTRGAQPAIRPRQAGFPVGDEASEKAIAS
jgi:hypothetical protein